VTHLFGVCELIYIFVHKGENDINYDENIRHHSTKFGCQGFVHPAWGNYISPTLNTSIQAHHIQLGLIAVPWISKSPDTRHRGLGSFSGQSMCDSFTE